MNGSRSPSPGAAEAGKAKSRTRNASRTAGRAAADRMWYLLGGLQGSGGPRAHRCCDEDSHGCPFSKQRYDREVERGVHDRGGWASDAPIDRSEHELEDWELLTDALVGVLGRGGVMNVDELRRGIESMPPDEYERASYYERWLFSVESVLTEKGVLAPGELDRRIEG
jgi:Nitrile hydratase beta subunit